MINVVSSSRYKINRPKIKSFLLGIFEKEQISQDQILNVVFVGKNKMKIYTEKYKNEKETLPILSFKYNENIGDEILFGDIVICYPLVILLAAERNKRVDEMINELIKHGVENLLK